MKTHWFVSEVELKSPWGEGSYACPLYSVLFLLCTLVLAVHPLVLVSASKCLQSLSV